MNGPNNHYNSMFSINIARLLVLHSTEHLSPAAKKYEKY